MSKDITVVPVMMLANDHVYDFTIVSSARSALAVRESFLDSLDAKIKADSHEVLGNHKIRARDITAIYFKE